MLFDAVTRSRDETIIIPLRSAHTNYRHVEVTMSDHGL
ncbi:hypothetical protein PAMC26577_25770 [Caballeronia sordidicola]|uniref:Uncharacterized protein n=1 Tax=Caballeronia sordidicola TaxID=196367 RepID=A0A242MJN0_CABSO|nr:hypothetical protein PAMC26577_25770 [Caballeronia sordidicola]